MTASLSERVLAVFVGRLAGISTGNGYATNAGALVMRARPVVDPQYLPAIVVWNDGEAPDTGASGEAASMTMHLRVSVDLHVRADQAQTGHNLELLLADAKRAVLIGRGGIADAGGTIGVLSYDGADISARSDGNCSESVALHFTVTYQEAYGDPSKSR